MSNTVIIGIDEAGRGPLAGPVVAATVHLPYPVLQHSKEGWFPENMLNIRLFDSKELTEDERNELRRSLRAVYLRS